MKRERERERDVAVDRYREGKRVIIIIIIIIMMIIIISIITVSFTFTYKVKKGGCSSPQGLFKLLYLGIHHLIFGQEGLYEMLYVFSCILMTEYIVGLFSLLICFAILHS